LVFKILIDFNFVWTSPGSSLLYLLWLWASCFAHTSPKHYATLGNHSVCYNMMFDWFSEFSSLIYYLGIEHSIYRGFKNFIKGKCQILKNFLWTFKIGFVYGIKAGGLIVKVLRLLLTPIMTWFVYDKCHMSSI
jgi:hypothetical protein